MVIIMKKLEIRDLHVNAGEKEILKGIDLDINTGEIHAIMGPNGNGKSTLLQTIMGHPAYTVTKGSILFDGEDVLSMSVDERSKKGLFLAMQYPKEIAGVTNSDFLRAGGEKKRNEILQMMMLHPSIAMLDEIDSGLDVDAIKLVSDAIHELYDSSEMGLMIVSHYERFFTMIKPTHSHVIVDGRIVVEGDDELVYKIDSDGYDWLYEELKIQPVKEERPLVYSLGTCARNPRGKNV